jgi:hypothetical protein
VITEAKSLSTFGHDWLTYCGVSYGAGTPVSALVPIPPACGDVKDRNRKNGLSDLDELDRNSVVVLTNTSEENETIVAALVSHCASPTLCPYTVLCEGLSTVLYGGILVIGKEDLAFVSEESVWVVVVGILLTVVA